MAQAKQGDKVKVHYTGKFEDGQVFDSSVNGDPLEFTIGEGQVIPGFENAVVGMDIGDTKTTNIPSDEAYGPRRDEMVLSVKPEQFPPDITPTIGEQLQVRMQDGTPVIVTVAEVAEDKVLLDANHPMAGRDLVFDLELIGIV